ncbi:COG4223 family protein [Sulfitobacter guttiformis]|uniref:COG4223 family protein n=1 Tax=Sulfitobacter guttiformis TaxID=74349 RepID=UPI000469A7A7|nr:hypothetical protein [Sulfitobacter guttiformis]
MKNKAEETKIEDAVIVEAEVSKQAPLDTKPDVTGDPATEAEDVEVVEPSETHTEDEKTDETKPEDILAEEPEATPRNEHEAVHPAPVVARPPEQKSIFLPLVLGGIVAGVVGFMASEFDAFGKDDAAITNKLRSDLSSQQERIAALESAEPPTTSMASVDLTPIETQLSDIEGRLLALEERPAVAPSQVGDTGAAEVYAAELEALKQAAETQRGEIAALLSNAKTVEQATADAARIASGQTAIASILSAIDAGQPFADAVATLSALDIGEIDPALTANADSGVATLSALQSEFPDQARTALAAARASGGEEGQQGIGSFLKRSLGARSVVPREGNDPDAVLSRAEAAIKTGDLAVTLTELDALPEEAQAAIEGWRTAADARLATRTAADALAKRLTAD